MDQQKKTGRFTVRQERKFRRFNLRYPVHVEFRSREPVFQVDTSSRNVNAGGLLLVEFHSKEPVFQVDTVSRNVSAGGLLLEAHLLIPQGTSVSFVMILRGSQFVHPIELAGEGEVVRVEPGGPEAGFGIAVKCTSPISRIDHSLGQSSRVKAVI